jgi:hypothetical protein
MPFEGAGAVASKWRLTLPQAFRPFDYNTINDVILHISYEAEYDGLLAQQVEAQNAATQGTLSNILADIKAPLPRALSLRQEFSNTFHRLLHNPALDGDGAPLELSAKHFPLFLQGRVLQLQKCYLVLHVNSEAFLDDDGKMPEKIKLPKFGLTRDRVSLGELEFKDETIGGLPAAPITFPENAKKLDLRKKSATFSLTVKDAADFKPSPAAPSDPSPLDEAKLEDVYLYLNYVVS